MATLPPVPNVVRIKYQWTIGLDTTCFNILHAKYSGTPPHNSDCVSIANGAIAAITAGVGLSTGPDRILKQVTVTDLSDPAGGQGVVLTNNAGTAGGGTLPASSCALVEYTIQRRYRGGRPRTYWPMGTDTDLLNAQTWSPSAITNFGLHHGTTTGQIVAQTWPGGNITGLCSVSYYEGGTWHQTNPPNGPYKRYPTLRPNGPLVDSFVSSTVMPTIGTLRRRTHGRR